jgi:hypothetical protein
MLFTHEIASDAILAQMHGLNSLSVIIDSSRVNKPLKIKAMNVIEEMSDYYQNLRYAMKLMTHELEFYKSKYEPIVEQFEFVCDDKMTEEILVSQMMTNLNNVVYYE